MHVDVRRQVGALSIELQQEVEVARAVSTESRVLVLDEATSSLSEAATERLLQHVEVLRKRAWRSCSFPTACASCTGARRESPSFAMVGSLAPSPSLRPTSGLWSG